jgi:hypothetical protein
MAEHSSLGRAQQTSVIPHSVEGRAHSIVIMYEKEEIEL